MVARLLRRQGAYKSAEALRSLPADRKADKTVGRSAGVLYLIEK